MTRVSFLSVFSFWSARISVIATLIALAAILVASLSPVDSAGDPGSADKTMHVIAYAIAVIPLAAAPLKSRLRIALGALIWSGTIELVQPLVGRSASFSDLMANATGVLLGLFVAVMFRRVLVEFTKYGEQQ